MTLPSVIRIFFAIDLPDSAKEKITTVIDHLKQRSKTNAIRWTRQENLHITLQFLAEVRTEHVVELVSNVRARLSGTTHKSTISVGMLHLFPNPYRPRVIVLDITPQEVLASLAGIIGEGIKAVNYPIESRPFRGHLTLGRIKHAQGVNLNFLSEFKIPKLDKIEVQEVVLFRSEPQKDGSKYIPMEKISL